MRFASDFATDRYIHDHLRAALPEKGWAVNVGANDGLYVDNTLWLEDSGWRVLCIEPIPEAFERLRVNREWSCNYACSDSDAEDVPFHNSGPSHSSLLGEVGVQAAVIRVRTRTLDRLLEEHSFPKLDYVSIDTENTEHLVLAGLTLERWKPTMLVIEKWHEPREAPEGYEHVHRCGLDDIFLRKDRAS